jgi:hypothetical protein
MKALFLATVSTLLFADGAPELIGLRTTLSAETLRLPQQETLGLLGLSSTADLGSFYLGPGFYGAARGGRGGFFTFGLEGGLRGRPTSLPLELEAGLFVGGGGGGQAPQGGGLMLRPHVGAAITFGRVRLGAELSRVRFPNGDIDSTQAALTLAFTSDRLWVPDTGWKTAFEGPVIWEHRDLEMEALRIEPSGTAHTRSGTPQQPLDLAGLTLTRDLRGSWFRFLTAEGAVRGSNAGYAQALAGMGLRIPMVGPFGLEARLGAGLGGGGNVDVGGGFLLSGEGALALRMANWGASTSLGFLKAPSGQLGGRAVSVRIAYRSSAPVPAEKGEAMVDFDLADWRVGTGVLIYRRAQRLLTRDGEIQLMTLRADRKLSDQFYLSGEAGSATGGGSGGYSTGLAGLGCQTSIWAQQRLFLETALGAGGGGSLRSGGGLLASLRGGWRLELPRGLGLEASVGRVRSLHGGLDTTTLGVGLHLRFKAIER